MCVSPLGLLLTTCVHTFNCIYAHLLISEHCDHHLSQLHIKIVNNSYYYGWNDHSINKNNRHSQNCNCCLLEVAVSSNSNSPLLSKQCHSSWNSCFLLTQSAVRSYGMSVRMSPYQEWQKSDRYTTKCCSVLLIKPQTEQEPKKISVSHWNRESVEWTGKVHEEDHGNSWTGFGWFWLRRGLCGALFYLDKSWGLITLGWVTRLTQVLQVCPGYATRRLSLLICQPWRN